MQYLELNRDTSRNGVWRAVPMTIGSLGASDTLGMARQAQCAVGKAGEEIVDVNAEDRQI